MNSLVLESVIEITKQRDIDSLEYSFVATLAELVSPSSISINKLLDEEDTKSIEEVVRLDIMINKKGEYEYIWSEAPSLLQSDENIEQCLNSGKHLIVEKDPQSISLLMPLGGGEKPLGLVTVCGGAGINASLDMLKAFVKIYENYLFILNESERDKLTSLFNRRTFDSKLERLLKFQENAQKKTIGSGLVDNRRKLLPDSTAWLVIIDIDHFKKVNDTYGHVCGDEVILMLSQKMRECFRNTDLLFRFGGEEFVIILEPIPEEMAKLTLQRFRKTIEKSRFPLVGSITISIGYSKISKSDYPPTVLDNADKALYYAKENGRNRVYSYEELVESRVFVESDKSGSVDLF